MIKWNSGRKLQQFRSGIREGEVQCLVCYNNFICTKDNAEEKATENDSLRTSQNINDRAFTGCIDSEFHKLVFLLLGSEGLFKESKRRWLVSSVLKINREQKVERAGLESDGCQAGPAMSLLCHCYFRRSHLRSAQTCHVGHLSDHILSFLPCHMRSQWILSEAYQILAMEALEVGINYLYAVISIVIIGNLEES